MANKQYEEMSITELKALLFDIQSQIQVLQSTAQNIILPILNNKIKEESTKTDNASVNSINQTDGITAKAVKAKEA